MRTFLARLATGVFCSALFAATAQAAGAAGMADYNWLVGNWNCAGSGPLADANDLPRSTSGSIVTSKAPNTLELHLVGPNFSSLANITYLPKRGIYANPYMYGDGSYGAETSRSATFQNSVWTGVLYDAAGRWTLHIRDIYTRTGNDRFTDRSETFHKGTWELAALLVCTRVK